MTKEDESIVLKIEDIIDIILDNQNNYSVTIDKMIILNDYFKNNHDLFNEEFIRSYINFLEIFNTFFEFLFSKIEECEQDLLNKNEIESDYYFSFSLTDFKNKKVLKDYLEMIDELDNMFKDNDVLKGIVLFMHLNRLLNRYNFTNNKIKVCNNNPCIDIDYASRLVNFKEEYITIFRTELEEGIRNSVFVDDEEIKNYIIDAIKELKNELCV